MAVAAAGLQGVASADAEQAPAMSSGQPQSPAEPTARSSRPHWTVDHGEVYCTLSRYYGPGQNTFAIRTIPGTGRVELLVSNPRWRVSPISSGTPIEVLLEPGNSMFRVNALTGRLPGNIPLLAFLDLNPDLLDSVAAS